MTSLLDGDFDSVVEKPARQPRAGEAGNKIPGEIDRVELDMCEGVEESDSTRQ